MTEQQPITWTETTCEGVQYRTTEQPMPGRSAQAHKRNPLFVGYVEVKQGGAWVAQGMQANQSPRGAVYGATDFTGLRPNEAAFKAARWLELQVRVGKIVAEPVAPASPKTTTEIRPMVEAYVRTHYTTTEDISCGRCGRDDQECAIYFGPTFLGTLQGRPANYDPMCWEDAVEFEMNARADSGEWDPDLEEPECEGCGTAGVPLFPCNVNDPENIAVNCAACLDDPEGAAELREGEPPMTTGRMHWTIFDISVCDACGAQNWYDEDQTTCPRCDGLGLANRAAWQRYDAMIARGYR